MTDPHPSLGAPVRRYFVALIMLFDVECFDVV